MLSAANLQQNNILCHRAAIVKNASIGTSLFEILFQSLGEIKIRTSCNFPVDAAGS